MGPVLNIQFTPKVKIKSNFFYFSTGTTSPSGLRPEFVGLKAEKKQDPTDMGREVYSRPGEATEHPQGFVQTFSPLGNPTRKFRNGLFLDNAGDLQAMKVPLTVNGFHIGIWAMTK